MSSQSNPVQEASTPAAAAAAATSSGAPAPAGASGYSSSTTISSMDQLQQAAPEVYQAMLQGIAIQICGQMQQQEQTLVQIIKQATQDAET
jgi:hypothetical protein